jgi:predicted DNA-binding transcriptional regulator AlpA
MDEPTAIPTDAERAEVAPLLWDRSQVVAALNISERSFDRLCARKKFPAPVVLGPRLHRWTPETVRRWIEMQAKRATGK